MLFGSTRGAINYLLKMVKRVAFAVSLVMQLIYMAYLVFMMASGRGIIALNVAMMTLSVGYLVYFLCMEYRFSDMGKAQKKVEKKLARRMKRIFTYIKFAFKTFNLGVVLYGIGVNEINPSSFSTIFTSVMVIIWIVELLVEIGKMVITYIVNVLAEAIEDDKRAMADKAKEPERFIKKAGRGIKRLFGFGTDEPEEDDRYVRDERFVRWEDELREEREKEKEAKK